MSGYPFELPPGGLAGSLPGVLSARREGGRLLVRADPAASDSVLRALLADGDQVHVVAVQEQAEDRR